MATELSVRGKNEFDDLIRALEWSDEFAIYFAVINPPLIRKQMADELKVSLEKEKIQVHSLELNSSYFDLLSIIPEKVPSYCLRGTETEIRYVLFIFGAEEAIAADAETQRLFFDCLNWQRDKLRETIACPLVIWLPEFALRILALETPDFWAWRSGVYYLEPESVGILRDTQELLRVVTSEYDVLTYQEKIRRLQQFKALIEDYEKHQFEGKQESELLEIQFDLLREAGKISFSLANYKDAKQYFIRCLKIAERLKGKEHFLLSFVGLGVVSTLQGDYTTATEYAKKAFEISQDLGDKSIIAPIFGLLGSYASIQNDYNKAEEFFMKELKIGKELENNELIASALEHLGILANEQKRYTEAKSFLEQSLKINEEIGDKKKIANNLIELSDLAKNQGDINEAVRRIEEAQAISNEIKYHRVTARALEKRGSLAADQGDYPRARKYYEESLNIHEQLCDKPGIGAIYTNLGNIARDSGDYEEARRRYKESLKIYKQLGDKHNIASIYTDLGKIAMDSGDYEEAKRKYKESLKLFEEIGAKDFIALIQKLLETFEKIKKLDAALEQVRQEQK
jgi:tetratricopeptide (TPR) repeat protein